MGIKVMRLNSISKTSQIEKELEKMEQDINIVKLIIRGKIGEDSELLKTIKSLEESKGKISTRINEIRTYLESVEDKDEL